MALRASISLSVDGGHSYQTSPAGSNTQDGGLLFAVRAPRVVVGQVLLDGLGQGVHGGHEPHECRVAVVLAGQRPAVKVPDVVRPSRVVLKEDLPCRCDKGHIPSPQVPTGAQHRPGPRPSARTAVPAWRGRRGLLRVRRKPQGRCRSVKAQGQNELNEGGLIRVCDDLDSASLLPVFRPPEPG